MKLIDDDKEEITVFLCRTIALENGQDLEGKKYGKIIKNCLKMGS
ncbi:hypothetical protein JQ036_15660 [Clostridium botulinum]|nr:hypothetical protein [Clostridium botulinum]